MYRNHSCRGEGASRGGSGLPGIGVACRANKAKRRTGVKKVEIRVATLQKKKGDKERFV